MPRLDSEPTVACSALGLISSCSEQELLRPHRLGASIQVMGSETRTSGGVQINDPPEAGLI